MPKVPPFVFDEQVARIFPDMIRRSIPGYNNLIQLTGVLAARFARPQSLIYDLGCSLGASTRAIIRELKVPGCRILAVDNSTAMLKRAQALHQTDSTNILVEWCCADITEMAFAEASVVVSNFTLQFLPSKDHAPLIKNIRASLHPKGAFLLAEKVCFADAEEQDLSHQIHHDFKRSQHYSELEIAQKQSALAEVLHLSTPEQHQERLKASGFRTVLPWFRCLDFVAFLALP